LSDAEFLALARAAEAGDPLARLRLERLLDRQPTDATRAALEACAEALERLFQDWWSVEPGARRLVALGLAAAFAPRAYGPGNFWVAVTGGIVWVGRPRGSASGPVSVDRLALERWARLNS
jgi:hypothetical protein